MSQAGTAIPQYLLHGALGPLVIGTWFNMALLSFEATQVYRYFVKHPLFYHRSATRSTTTANGRRADLAWIPIVVLWMFALDIVSSGVGCALAYTYTVAGWGNIAMLLSNDWMMALFGISTGLSTLTMHLFLIFRYYTLSRATVVSSILCVLALTACGIYMFLSISLITMFRHLADRPKMQSAVTAWAVDTALTDWLISGTLMWFLARIRTTVDDSQGTVKMLTRLIRISSLSGAAPAVLALLTFIAYMSSKETNLAFMFSLSSGRAATLSVLYNINSRDGLTSDTQRASAGATASYLETTVEPGKMFHGRSDSWSIVSASKECALDSLGKTVRAATDDTDVLHNRQLVVRSRVTEREVQRPVQ